VYLFLLKCLCVCVSAHVCICAYLAELLRACVLVRTRSIVLFGFMPVCMRVYVWVYVIECIHVSACKHVSVWEYGCAIV
jgi:hypothetical protein